MAEPIKTPTPEVYAREALYMELLARHSKDFDKLFALVPDDRPDLKKTFQAAYNVEPDRLLSREKLAKLKEENKSVFDEVSAIYKNFLEDQLGFN